MNRKAFQTCAAFLGMAFGLLAGPAGAQAPPNPANGDWPNLGAFHNRQGQNADPATYTSGLNNLRWLSEDQQIQLSTLFLDNTSFTNTDAFINGPYNPPSNGQVNAPYPNAAAWPGVVNLDNEALDPYLVPIRTSVVTDGNGVQHPVDYNDRLPAYNYAQCTPSAHGTDPRVPLDPSELKIWEWEFAPTLPYTGSVQNYAVYAWLPTGGTAGTGINLPSTRAFPQRYFVYEVIYGNGQSFVDVVDTAITGGGFVRLGGGNGTNSTVFPWDNTHPIRIRLYNTVPRTNGVLAVDGAIANATDAREKDLAHKYLVYADAIQAQPQNGTFLASPTAATWIPGTIATLDWQVTVARNSFISSSINGTFSQQTNGTVTSYQANPLLWNPSDGTIPLERWNFDVVGESANATNYDDSAATFGGAWAVATTSPQIGANHHEILAEATDTATGTYAPTLSNGRYAIYVYNPGTTRFASGVTYLIYSGATLVDTVVLDQSTRPGWVRLGTQYYDHDNDTANTIKVVIGNADATTAEQGVRYVDADAMRFVSPTSVGISSSPVHATVNIKQNDGSLVATKVVIVADESGKIHCLDQFGNGDGTTTEYWSYPSTLDQNTADPNLTENIDGTIDSSVMPVGANVPTATMPSGFDLSTAAIANVTDSTGTAKDLLYIASTNGRVYCIDMAGRGDFDKTTRKIGTTARQWTFPNDYDPTAPANPIGASTLGAVRGSIAFGDPTGSAPTIYVPARQGRIYALKAVGTAAELLQRRTSARWTFPTVRNATLPEIVMTPTLAFGRLYFGTVRSATDAYPGQFFALNATTGAQVWRFDGTLDSRQFNGAASTGSDVTQYVDAADTTQGRVSVGAWITGPVAVSQAELQSGTTAPQVDTVYALNQNAFLYGFDAATGAILVSGTHSDGTPRRYESNELASLAYGNLTYTRTTEYATTGAQAQFPVIVVPGQEGTLHRVFARLADSNVFEGITAGYNVSLGTTLTSAAAANNTMFVGNAEGRLYAFDNTVNSANVPFPALSGGQQGIPPNDPRGLPYRSLKIRLVTRAGYLGLRTRSANNEGSLTYNDIDGGTYDRAKPPANQRAYAFEWGETAYIVVYNFPYATTNQAGDAISPPTINVTLTIEGKVARTRGVVAQKFAGDTGGQISDGNGGFIKTDGYAVYPFTFQGGGAMSLPPGNGVISATISTAALSTTTAATEISQDPRSTSPARVPFIMANPLAVVVEESVGGAQDGIATNAPTGLNLTGTIDSYDLANRVNGSPDLAGTGGFWENQLLATAGFAQHGSSVTARAYVIDRSLMALIRPEGRGIENLRVSRTNLALQGGTLGLYRLLDPTVYPGFEDLPGNYPNDSLDYPDIGRENVSAISNPESDPGNPVLESINLLPPLDAKTGGYLNEDNQDDGRVPQRTPLNLVVDVPQFQPPINVFPKITKMTVGLNGAESDDLASLHHSARGLLTDPRDPSGNTPLAQGYFGRITAFVDSTGDGKLTLDSREAYRGFNLSLGVLPQVGILATTPNVDLGSLASGTGYAPGDPSAFGALSGPFDPWSGIWNSAYKAIGIRNTGNVNLLDLRLAKAGNDPTTYSGSNTYSQTGNQPWQIVSGDNDPLAWMGGSTVANNGQLLPGSLWSNIDSTFAVPNNRVGTNDPRHTAVILPKARVTDRVGPDLKANPTARANPNTGSNGSNFALNGNYPLNVSPKVAVSVPIGFPVGNYTSRLRVFEDYAEFDGTNPRGALDQVLNYFPNLQTSEAYSDPITVSFKGRETRMTNNTTPRTASVIDPNLLPTSTGTLNSAYRNASPAAMRDGLTGDVSVIWSSNRPSVSPTNSTANPPTTGSRLYFAQMVSTATKQQDPAPGFNPPLWDLSRFDQTGSSWLAKSTSYTNGYPANPGALFKIGANDQIADATTSFDSPSLPAAGNVDPLNPGATISPLMAFVGTGEVATQTGRVTRSRVFVTNLAGRGASFAPSDATPTPTKDDPLTAKGKPSIVQVSGAAFLFYPVTSAGQTGINVSRYTSAFDAPVPLDFGGGFSSVNSPSVTARLYTGPTDANSGVAQNQPILDVSFAGKLRGRANAEVYLGRMALAPGNGTYALDPNFRLLPQQVNERLVGEGGGVFRARGVDWSRTAGFSLVQNLNGTLTPMLVPNSGTVDRQSGLVVFSSRLGGKVYFDPNLGTARFVGGAPSANAEIRLTYTPTFLRVTPGGLAAYSSVNALFDGRYVSERDYWFATDAVQSFGNVPTTTPLTNDRYFFAYGRGAAGGGVTARPYSTTMRFGLRLPTRVAALTDGRIIGVKVTNNAFPYQVDAANGRIYFEKGDEGKTVQVTYTGVDEGTNQSLPQPITVSGTVSYVLEREETPVLVDEATNDSALTAFLDPFTYANVPRPPLVWLFYVSTRAGSPDVYFQTIAPRLTPFAK